MLHDLRAAILDAGVFTDEDEVNPFNDLYQHGAEAHELSPILDRCVERFEIEIEWDENGKPDFKIKCKQFVKVYSRVAAIMPFENIKWEKLYWFLRQLIPLLKAKNKRDDYRNFWENSGCKKTVCLIKIKRRSPKGERRRRMKSFRFLKKRE